jgi:uncharacterized protein YecE (DUF72 family)
MKAVRIGRSGWNYDTWHGRLYLQKRELGPVLWQLPETRPQRYAPVNARTLTDALSQ